MTAKLAMLLTLLVPLAASGAAADDDLAQGEKLYFSECRICHGNVAPDSAARDRGLVRLALREQRGTAFDFAIAPPAGTLAFAPPFGPNLRGVVGRPAGSVPGYTYSKTMLATLKGMEWSEAALNVWITNPQAWVPGVYMFYKQPDPEKRRKIILYLKANSP